MEVSEKPVVLEMKDGAFRAVNGEIKLDLGKEPAKGPEYHASIVQTVKGFDWAQLAGAAVTYVAASSAIDRFLAPLVPIGGQFKGPLLRVAGAILLKQFAPSGIRQAANLAAAVLVIDAIRLALPVDSLVGGLFGARAQGRQLLSTNGAPRGPAPQIALNRNALAGV